MHKKRSKYFNRNLLTLAMGILACTSAWASGPGSTGGGDVPLSSESQVRHAIRDASAQLVNYLQNNIYSDDSSIDVQIATAILKKISIEKITSGVDFILSDGYCTDSNRRQHAGGAIIGDTATPICLSMMKLRAVPADSLKTELGALIAHELAHQVGYLEFDAVTFQNDMSTIFKNARQFGQLMFEMISIDRAIEATEASISKNAAKEKTCVLLANTQANLDGFIQTALYEYNLSVEPRVEGRFINWVRDYAHYLSKIELRGYCGVSLKPDAQVIDYGDSKKLLEKHG